MAGIWPIPSHPTMPAKKRTTGQAYQPSTESKNQGSAHGRAILDEDKVMWSRRLVRQGVPLADIAQTWGVSISVLSRAVRGLTWSHVKEPAVDEVDRLSVYTVSPSRRKRKPKSE